MTIMAKNQTVGFTLKIFSLLFFFFLCLPLNCSSYGEQNGYNSFTVSSFSYPESQLKPYDWRYIRVDLPPWFSSLSLSISSNVDTDNNNISKLPKSKLPMICFRDGSPPVPDVLTTSLDNLVSSPLTNDFIGRIRSLEKVEQCYLLLKNIVLSLTNEQISPGVLYVGLFNGIGPIRTQSKMISRGTKYSFSANVTVEGCTTSTMWGPKCNQPIDSLSCVQSSGYKDPKNISDVVMYNVITCRNAYNNSCHCYNESKVYALEVLGMTQQLVIKAKNTNGFNGTLALYASYGAIPSVTWHDYSSQISKDPLVIPLPKIGRWYIAILPINQTEVHGSFDGSRRNIDLCVSLDWQVLECLAGRAGANCTSQTYNLQAVLRENPSVPFESYYLPITDKISVGTPNFLLEPLLSNSCSEDEFGWTYFLLDIPHGVAGGNIHIQLKSNTKINYEIYSRFGGFPSLDTWDYYYANSTTNSNGSMFFQLYDSSDKKVGFNVLNAREGAWSFGIRHQVPTTIHSNGPTTMSIFLERCPNQCSNHGKCKSVVDASGLTLYSFCFCNDGKHGGYDCSIELVSHTGYVGRAITLIASNAAAILPAYWALRQKAFAECVLYASSGISSALYHACDVGIWCALPFGVLQFMDFWLSFMAVVSTFVYLVTINEDTKRFIHTTVSILTALMAASGPTRPSNIILVISVGALGLLIGWLIEYFTTIKSRSCSTSLCCNILESCRRQDIEAWLLNTVKKLQSRFRWVFVLIGFVALSVGGVSWELETIETYWLWHSIWHALIYTTSFLFLCSKVPTPTTNNEDQGSRAQVYQLTRQNSFQRD